MTSATGTARGERTDYVVHHLLQRSRLLVRLLSRQVPDREISRTEGEILATLSEGPRRITELAELQGLAQPTMTVLIKRLEGRGLVTREGLPEDGRVVVISITKDGTSELEGFRADFREALRSDLEELPDDRLTALSDATEALGSLLDDLQRRIPQ
jgi:DNA-binding MarR family transcriptional regulator